MSIQKFRAKNLVRNPRQGSTGDIPADVEITVNWDDLVNYLARKAAHNASNRSSFMRGMIKLKITKMHHDQGAA